jgi:NAD(P)-dependent dehydrogenase (short-subunit alcohol dehydrogenase family)
MTIRFDERVVIVTGAGSGLGRAHALGFAARGAKVVVNDLGSTVDGSGRSSDAARGVVNEIEAAGGVAMADGANVVEVDQVRAMVERALATWGRVDILVNNAGILRDKTFAKMEFADFRAVIDVHLMGAVNCTKAAWEPMRERNYGRVVFTSSASGLYGNFGQANYGAAKAAVVGLMNVLIQEGRKHDIRVNAIAPVAATRMTEGVLPPGAAELLAPDAVTPAVLYLASDGAPSGVIISAGAGSFARTLISETEGIYLPPAERTPEAIQAQFAVISDPAGQRVIRSASEQTAKYLERAMAARATKPATS